MPAQLRLPRASTRYKRARRVLESLGIFDTHRFSPARSRLHSIFPAVILTSFARFTISMSLSAWCAPRSLGRPVFVLREKAFAAYHP
jgi:hypothetical protein